MNKKTIFYFFVLTILAVALFFAPAVLFVETDRILYKHSKLLYFPGDYDFTIDSHEHFKNLTIIVPAPRYGSVVLFPDDPKLARVVNINGSPYFYLYLNDSFCTKTGKSLSCSIMPDIFLRPRIEIKNFSKYQIDNGSRRIRIFVSFDNASYVRISCELGALGWRYAEIFGQKIQLSEEPAYVTVCRFSVNVTKKGWQYVSVKRVKG